VLFQGSWHVPGSFSLINRRLLAGLRARGRDVVFMPSDGPALGGEPDGPDRQPDLYLFHGHPYDLKSAPGRVNLFILNYEYLDERPRDWGLFHTMRTRYDHVLVSSRFVGDMLSRAGVEVDQHLIPWAADLDEFHPHAPPCALAQADRFAFVFVGAANPRKGLELALKAYDKVFSARDDVMLMLKEAFRMRHMQAWVDAVARRHSLIAPPAGETAVWSERGRKAPVIWSNGFDRSVAGWYTAADCGLFPHRGEGFGMALLECMACGTPIISPAGSGPDDFCTPEGATMIGSRPKKHLGDIVLEPDFEALCEAMWAAYQRGRISAGKREAVRASVAGWTWQTSVEKLQRVLSAAEAARPRRTITPVATTRPRVAYSYQEAGRTSWRLICSWTARGLRRSMPQTVLADRSQAIPAGPFDIVVGQAENCLEAFQRAGANAFRLLHMESTALAARQAIVNREREACGLEPLHHTPMTMWKMDQEEQLAHAIVVASSVAASFFSSERRSKVHVVPVGMWAHRPLLRQRRRTMRYLFVSTDPYRKGVRLLFRAWDRLRLPRAELWCAPSGDILQSKELLVLLTRNPNIRLLPSLSPRAFSRLYAEIDWQVLPSLEDAFSIATGDGMGWGKPAIVSTSTGIVDLLTHGRDAIVIQSGSQPALEEALSWTHDNPRRLKGMGEAAYGTARRWPWRRYGDRIASLTRELYAEHAKL
jgi:glycosyltransferase involved in cell wall biosynthesis